MLFLVILLPISSYSSRVPHYLYKLELQGHTSWILGTFHDEIQLSKFQGVLEALQTSETLYVEKKSRSARNIDDFLALIEKRGLLKEDRPTERQRYNLESERKIRALLARLPGSQSRVATEIFFKAPIGVAYNYLLDLAAIEKTPRELPPDATAKGIRRQYMLDYQVVDAATELGKNVHSLDSTASNLDFFLSAVKPAHLNDLIRSGINDDGVTNRNSAYTSDRTLDEKVLGLIFIYDYLNG